jgi:small-conductance mechanosensitive channel
MELMNMTDWLPSLPDLFSADRLASLLRAILLIIAGLALARLISGALVRAFRKSLDSHRSMLLRRGSYYLVLALFLITALFELGFNLSVLLGTAGILTVAIGFASQTSMSNLISGLFLVGERPFLVGDLVQIGTTVGEVLSIDLLSVKLRKFDNTFVRIPNELIINSEVMTLTKFPIRRIDLHVGVAYKEDIDRVREILFEVAESNPLVLEEPQPLYIFRGFGESSLDIQFSIWVQREKYLDVRNRIQEDIKRSFDAARVEIPFPHRTLYSGSITDPFPVRIVASDSTPSQQD